jgi:hypothetical protein
MTVIRRNLSIALGLWLGCVSLSLGTLLTPGTPLFLGVVLLVVAAGAGNALVIFPRRQTAAL